MEQADLKVLMISSDRNILVPGSAVSARMKEYGGLINELHIILLLDAPHGLKNGQISNNVFVYPTNSINKFFRPLDAVKIGEKIVKDVSLITTQDPFECGWVGMRLKKKFGIPLEIQLHTDPNSPYFSGFLNLIRKRIMKIVMKYADTVRDVAKLPIYIDRKRVEGEPKFNLHHKYGFKNVLLMVSRLSKEKNISMALKAVKDVPDTGLVIVGSGPEKFAAQDNVIFAGWQEDLASYYKTADIFLQTSNFEGYGMSLVEAGLSGLAVISTPVGIAKELKNGQEILIAKDSFELAASISELIKNPEKRLSLATNLKHALEEKVYTKEAYLNKLKENWEKTARLKA